MCGHSPDWGDDDTRRSINKIRKDNSFSFIRGLHFRIITDFINIDRHLAYLTNLISCQHLQLPSRKKTSLNNDFYQTIPY